MLKFLYVYKWATFGGVERVILNRAEAFKKFNIPCRILMHYLNNGGALRQFKDYIDKRGLNDYIQFVKDINKCEYDYVVSIDTPEIFSLNIPTGKLLVECHTAYIENRKYLDVLPDGIRNIIVPSIQFKNEILSDNSQLTDKLTVIRNYVPKVKLNYTTNIFAGWNKRPLLYLGRMDELKNYKEVLDIFVNYRALYGDELILVLLGPCLPNVDLFGEVERRGILDRTVILPPVGFDKTGIVYEMIRQKEGIFISASLGESYSLSAAESITAGLPVILSGISSHVALVNNDTRLLYTLGSVSEAASKIHFITKNYKCICESIETYQQPLSVESFICDWNAFIRDLI